MISKELLSEVLGIKVVEIYKEKGEIYRYRRYKEEIDGCHIHNIYELAHMCKEWAIKQSSNNNFFVLEISSGALTSNVYCFVEYRLYDEYSRNGGKDFKYVVTDLKTEPEAIFKACEWILKDKR